MDRPSRKHKIVNYCEAKDFDDDEDFACVKAPPSKKAREDAKQEPKKSSSKSSSQETGSQPTASRKPLNEKLYARDLEAAITLSLLNNADGIKEQTPIGEVKARLPVDENTDPASLRLSNCSVDGAVMGLDEITSVKGSPAAPRQRKATEQEQRKRDEDEEYEPKLTPDSDSDDDFSGDAESEDEEFTVKKVSKTKKEKVRKNDKTKPTPAAKKEKQPSKPSKSKPHTAASTPMRSPPAAKAAPRRPVSSSTAPISKPVVSLSPAGGRVPKWNPPAQIGQSPTSAPRPAVRSPGLRLGLSRLVRVKPLHPTVTSPCP